MSEIVLTPHQQNMCDVIIDWFNSIKNRYGEKRYIVCSGYAGTGKTTTLSKIVEYFGKSKLRVGCATYTGKAAHVLESKIPIKYTDYCGTIHGLIYKAVIDDEGKLVGFRRKEMLDLDIIIIDECSMINDDIFNDLIRYRKPIIFIGDSAQLPPVKADYFDIFQNTAFHLNKIHRQAANSPIIVLSMMIRNGDKIDKYYLNKRNIRFESYSTQNIVEEFQPFNDEIILCGMNKTRVAINRMVRDYNGFIRQDPYVGEKVINLQNNHGLGIMNGNIGIIKKIKNFDKDFAYEIETNFFDNRYPSEHLVYKNGFNKPKQEEFFKILKKHKVDIKLSQYEKIDIFDYGYCLSVHKCISDDTWLFSSNGLIQLKELNNGAEDGCFKSLNTGLKIFNGYYMEKPSHFYNNGLSNCKKICTTTNYSLICSNEHKVDVLGMDGYITQKCAKDLVMDDYLIIGRGNNVFSNIIKLPDYYFNDVESSHHCTIQYKLPKEMSKEFARFLGFIVADGTITNKGIQFSKRHLDVTEQFKQDCYDLFGYTNDIILRKSNDYMYYVNSVIISKFCYNIDGLHPNNKFVPKSILNTTKEFQIEFLKCIFEDGTVNLTKNGSFDHVELSMKNETLCDQIRMMLLNLGIVSTKREINDILYIYIYGNNARIFRDTINFVSDFKRSRMFLLKDDLKSSERKSIPYIHLILKNLIKKYGLKYDRKLDYTFYSRKTTNNILQYFIDKYKDAIINDDDFEHLKFILDKLFIDKLANIDNIKHHTYCLTMPETNKFIQNGFHASNSQGSQWNKVILINERNPYQTDEDFRKWYYTAVTRAENELVIFEY